MDIMSLNGELGRDAISSQKPVQRTPTHPCQPLKTPAGVWHGEAVADLRRVKRAVLRPGAHTHPLPLHWRFGSPAARRPPAHSPGPQVSALLLPHRPGCHHQPGLLREDSHPSLQDKQGARRLAGERGAAPGFPLVRRRPGISPSACAPWKAWGGGPGVPPKSQERFTPSHRDHPRQTHLNFPLRKCFLSPKLWKALLKVSET